MSNPWPRAGVHKLPDGAGWMVPSASQPGLYHHVTWGRDGARGPHGYKCSGCPRAKHLSRDGQLWMTQATTGVCRHVLAVARAEVADGEQPRPTGPAHPGLADER